MSLTVTGGVATLSTTNNLTLISGGNGTASLTYQGTIADLNAALNGLLYTPTANLSGAAAGQVTVATNDLGNSGSGGAKTSTDAITIDITPVNQPPSFTSGGNVTVPASGDYNQPWAADISAGKMKRGKALPLLSATTTPALLPCPPAFLRWAC